MQIDKIRFGNVQDLFIEAASCTLGSDPRRLKLTVQEQSMDDNDKNYSLFDLFCIIHK